MLIVFFSPALSPVTTFFPAFFPWHPTMRQNKTTIIMPSFLVGFVPLTLLPRGRCWSKRSFTTALLIGPNQEVLKKLNVRSEIERIEKKVVEGTHDLTGCRRKAIPPIPCRHSSSICLQNMTSNQWMRGMSSCWKGSWCGWQRIAKPPYYEVACMRFNQHLHFLDQGRWSRLISRCHGWWNTCLKSSSRQHSLRRSCALFAEFVFLMSRCELIMRRESEYFWRNQSTGVITSCADHFSGFWSVRYQYPELGSRASLRILIKMYLIWIPRLGIHAVCCKYLILIPRARVQGFASHSDKVLFCLWFHLYPCCMLYIWYPDWVRGFALHSHKVQICFWFRFAFWKSDQVRLCFLHPCCSCTYLSIKRGGAVRLAFVLRGGNTPFLQTSVHFAGVIDNIDIKIEYFGTLENKNKKTNVTA